jgi:glutamate racemase
LLREVIAAAVPPALQVIDSAEATAAQCADRLREAGLLPSETRRIATADRTADRFFATDSIAKFRSLGERFLAQPPADVQLVDLGG